MQVDRLPLVDPSIELMEALNAAAARLQRAVHARQEVLDAFVGELQALGLRGGIHLLDESGDNLRVASVALSSQLIRNLEKLTRMSIVGYELPVEKVRVLRGVLDSGTAVYIADTSEVVLDFLPSSVRKISKKILEQVGSLPGIYAPLIQQGRVVGILNVEGEGFSERTLPVITAFANHIAVALQNADLMASLRASEDFTQSTLDSLGANVAVIDRQGTIVAVNQAWMDFGLANGGDPEKTGVGAQYFHVDLTGGPESGELYAREANQGIQGVFEGRWPHFELLYPCHAPDAQRWFSLRATPFQSGTDFVVTVHTDITSRILAEKSKEQSEELFRSLVDSLQGAVFIFERATGNLLYANQGLSELSGYSTEELLRPGFRDLVFEEDRAEMQDRLRRHLAGEDSTRSMEMRMKTRSGELCWLEYRFSPIEYGGQPCFIGTAYDISERKQTSQALTASEKRFRTVIESISAAAFIFQGEKMVFANRKAELITGYTHGELLTLAFWELVHPDMQPLIKERGMARQRGETPPSTYEVKLLTKFGEVRWVEFNGSLVEFDGEPAVLGTAFDITARKQAEAQLQESESRFRESMNASPDAIYINTLKDGRYVYVNQGFSQMSGYAEEELLGTPAKQLGLWVNYRQRSQLVKALKASGHVKNFEVEFHSRDGRRIHGLLSASLIELDGVPHVLNVVKDLGELLQTRSQLEESESRFRTLVEYAGEAIVLLDGRNARFTEANPAAEALYGLPRVALLAVGPVELSPETQPDGRPSAIAARKYIELALAGEPQVFEWVHKRPNGTEVLCEVRLVRLPGRQDIVRGTVTDISERARTEQQMRVQSKALEAAGDAIVITDAEGDITWINPAFTRLTGYLPDEALGRNPRFLKSGVTPMEVYSELWQTIRAGAIWKGEFVNRRKDGSLYVESQVITPVFGMESKLTHFIAIKRDVTQSRQRERRLQAIVQVSQALRLAETTEDISLILLNQVEDLLEAQAVSIILKEPESGDYVTRASTGKWKDMVGMRFKPGESMTGQIINEPQTFINNSMDVHLDARFTRPALWDGLLAGAGLPLEAHDTVLGVLWAARAKPFLTEDIQLLEAIANIAAGALHRAELHDISESLFDEARQAASELALQVGNLERAKEEIDQRNVELSRLYRASEALLTGSTPDLRQVADQIVTLTLEEFGQANCSVLLVQPGERELMRAAVGGEYADEVQHGRLFLDGKGLAVKAIQSGQIVNIGDVRAVPDYVPNWQDAHSEIAIPMKVGERVLGVIDIQSANPQAFGQEDERVLLLFANRAALAIENARLFDDTRVHLGQLQALRDIDIAITSSLDIQLTLKVLLDQVLSQLNADAAAVMLLHNDELRFSAGRGFATQEIENSQLRLGEGVLGKAVLERRFVGIPDLSQRHDDFMREALLQREGFQSYFATPLIAKGEVLGALELFSRTPMEPGPAWHSFLQALAEQAAIAVNNAELFDRLQRAKTELEVAYSNTLRGWVRALDLRDKETEGHTQRVTELTARLAVLMGLPPDDLQHITRGALLHDIGKMAIPDSVLLKPGPLNEDERLLIEKHTEYARQFLSGIDYLRPALEIPACHHERWDGSGYPLGLKGEEIPFTARIFAVVDVWDALTSDRPYRKAWEHSRAAAYIREGAAVLFDPSVVRCFVEEILGEDMPL